MLYNDESIQGDAEGAINRSNLVRTVVEGIKRLSASSPSSVIGLTGPWGSGKTSLLHEVEERLSALSPSSGESPWKIVRHTPWMFNSLEAAALGLYSELMATLPPGRKTKDLRKDASSLLKKVAPFGVAGGVVGVDLRGALLDWSQALSDEKTPTELMQALSEAFSDIEHKVLVIMDDLDRLHPEELLSVFKLVRLLGRIPRVHYVLAYDEESLLSLLAQTEVTERTTSRALEYLEKIVQLRMDIPPLALYQRTELLNSHLLEIYRAHNLTLEPEQEQRLDTLWNEHLVFKCQQPRTIKQLVSTVDSLWRSVQGETDFVDFLTITYIRLHMKEFYELIYNSKDLIFQTRYLAHSSQRDSPVKLWNQWDERLQGLEKVNDLEIARHLSVLLFPALGYAKNNTYASSAGSAITVPKRIGNPLYMERYYQNSVLEDDISDAAIDYALRLLREGRGSASSRSIRHLLDALISQASITIPRVTIRSDDAQFPTWPFLRLAAEAYAKVEAHAEDPTGAGDEYSYLALNILEKTTPYAASIYTRGLLEEHHTRPFALNFVYRGGITDGSWLEPLSKETDRFARIYIRRELRRGNVTGSALLASLYWRYHNIGKEDAQRFVWHALKGAPEHTFWRLLEFITPMYSLSKNQAFYGDNMVRSYQALDSLLGYEKVKKHIAMFEERISFSRSSGKERPDIDTLCRRAGTMLKAIEEYKTENVV